MRMKDGVFENLGCLKQALGFTTPVLNTVRILTGNDKLSVGRAHISAMDNLQRKLDKDSYSAFEYLGYIVYFLPKGKDGPVGTTRYMYMSWWLMEDKYELFLKHKENRMHEVLVGIASKKVQYRRYRDMRCQTPENILENGSVSCNGAVRLEIIEDNIGDFSDEYKQEQWGLYGLAVGNRYRLCPEYLLGCPRLTQMLKSNGGDNAYSRAAFPDCWG